MIGIVFFRSEIVLIFTTLDSLKYLLENCLLIYLIDCIPELLFLSTASLLRVNGFNNKATFFYTILFPVYGIISAPFFCFVLNLKVYGLILSFCTGKLLIVLLAGYYLFASKWQVVEHKTSGDNSSYEDIEMALNEKI